ncbi:hypothetical protein BGW36DRAFT_452667 [Talaromyces proteolyticus]|uniref:Uncharacterized protein n=1 Tax=Talaromyces proteolyticus TaxID=1131652 RepID=A0AAD4PYK7_9EURO|nr:uncharacterized protein BGW36DRAFT_452667 [Talaromyces proteolyticus]KAH8694902.1 hypothetical protein BGW36DRAFT_452667 [Talaromyces proteolyticus]
MTQDGSQILPWKRMLEEITNVNDLTEKRILSLRSLAFSAIYLPLLKVNKKAFAKWTSKQRPELQTIIEYDARSECVIIKGRPYLPHQTVPIFFNHLFYAIAKNRGLQNFDFVSDMKLKRFTLVSPFEETRLVPEAYLKEKKKAFPSVVLLIGPTTSIKNITLVARRWLIGTFSETETVIAFTLTVNPVPTSVSALIRSKIFERNWGLSDDEIRILYNNVEALGTHVFDWYMENSTVKLGGEWVSHIYIFDRKSPNAKSPVATIRFSAIDYQINTDSMQTQQSTILEVHDEPVLEFQGETVRLNELAHMLHSCIKLEANKMAVALARCKLNQIGILREQILYDGVWRKYPSPGPDQSNQYFQNALGYEQSADQVE